MTVPDEPLYFNAHHSTYNIPHPVGLVVGTVVALPIESTLLPPPKLAFHSDTLPSTISIALKSAAAVSVGLTRRPLVIPLAHHV